MALGAASVLSTFGELLWANVLGAVPDAEVLAHRGRHRLDPVLPRPRRARAEASLGMDPAHVPERRRPRPTSSTTTCSAASSARTSASSSSTASTSTTCAGSPTTRTPTRLAERARGGRQGDGAADRRAGGEDHPRERDAPLPLRPVRDPPEGAVHGGRAAGRVARRRHRHAGRAARPPSATPRSSSTRCAASRCPPAAASDWLPLNDHDWMPMPSLRDRIDAGELVVCLALAQARTADIPMIAAANGFDAVYVDLEHTATSLRDHRRCSAPARSRRASRRWCGCPSHDHHHLTRALDVGAMGVIVPHVDTPRRGRGDRRRVPLPAARAPVGGGPEPVEPLPADAPARAARRVRRADRRGGRCSRPPTRSRAPTRSRRCPVSTW